MTSLYWLSLHQDQWQPQVQVGSGKESLDSQWRQLQQRPPVLGDCGSSSTGPPFDRCPGGRMTASAGLVSWMWSSLPATCPPARTGTPRGVPRFGVEGCLTSLNFLQGNVLSRAARWAGSSAGSFRLFWSNLHLSSTVWPDALPLYREVSSWDPSRFCGSLPRPNPTPTTLSPWPGTGPRAPVGLGIGLEALESSLAGAGVGIVPDGEVSLQPGEVGV